MHVTGLFAHAFPRRIVIAMCVVGAALLSACETLTPAPTEETAAPTPNNSTEIRTLNEKQAAEIRNLHEINAKLQLMLLERNAELTRLDDERTEAIQEVVRTKSKLRGIESKAEAASTMAEVEIALKQVKAVAENTKQDPGPGIREAEKLLAMSGAEFENSNY